MFYVPSENLAYGGAQFLIPYVYGTGTWRVNQLNEFTMNRWLASSQQIIADAYSQLGCEE